MRSAVLFLLNRPISSVLQLFSWALLLFHEELKYDLFLRRAFGVGSLASKFYRIGCYFDGSLNCLPIASEYFMRSSNFRDPYSDFLVFCKGTCLVVQQEDFCCQRLYLVYFASDWHYPAFMRGSYSHYIGLHLFAE